MVVDIAQSFTLMRLFFFLSIDFNSRIFSETSIFFSCNSSFAPSLSTIYKWFFMLVRIQIPCHNNHFKLFFEIFILFVDFGYLLALFTLKNSSSFLGLKRSWNLFSFYDFNSSIACKSALFSFSVGWSNAFSGRFIYLLNLL